MLIDIQKNEFDLILSCAQIPINELHIHRDCIYADLFEEIGTVCIVLTTGKKEKIIGITKPLKAIVVQDQDALLVLNNILVQRARCEFNNCDSYKLQVIPAYEKHIFTVP